MQSTNLVKNKIQFNKFNQKNLDWSFDTNSNVFNEKFVKRLIDENYYFDFTNDFKNKIAKDCTFIEQYLNYSVKYLDWTLIDKYLDLFLSLFKYRFDSITDKTMLEHHCQKYIINAEWLFEISKHIDIEKYIMFIYNKLDKCISFSDYIISINKELCVSETFIDTYIKYLDIDNVELSCYFKTKPSLEFFKKYKNKQIKLFDLFTSYIFYKWTTSELYDIANIIGIEKFNNYFKKYYWIKHRLRIIIEDNEKSKFLLTDKQLYNFQKVINIPGK